MSWWRTREALRRKPHLIDPYRYRNTEAARLLLAKEGLPDTARIMDLARRRAGMSGEEWEVYTGMSSRKLLRKCKNAMPIHLTGLLYVTRKAAAMWIAAILAVGFMAFTPAGRALAAAAVNTIGELINGILYVIANESREEPLTAEYNEEGVGETVVRFESVDELLDYVDKPVVYLGDESAISVSAEYQSTGAYGESAISMYVLEGGLTVIIRQDWCNSTGKGIVLADTKEYEAVFISDDLIVEGVYSTLDKGFMGITTIDDTVIYITMVGVDEENLESYLHRLTLG